MQEGVKVITRKYIEREREERDSFFLIEVQAVCSLSV